MRKAMIGLTAMLGGCLWSGCAVSLTRDGSVGFRASSTLEFFHTAPDEGCEAQVDILPWVQDEIKANREQRAILEQIKAAAEAPSSSG